MTRVGPGCAEFRHRGKFDIVTLSVSTQPQSVSNPQKVFLLGVGAQKCGTTWLNRHVMNDPAGFTPVFEYHVWDALYGAESDERLEQTPGLLDRLESWRLTRKRGYGKKNVVRWWMQRDPERYFDHFASILSDPECRVAADITPAYSGLPKEALQRIRNGFALRGIPVKVVFIMRDPVERCWSAVRMFQDKTQSSNVSQEELLRERYALPATEMRTRYDKTIANLEAVFDPTEIHYAIFEKMFSEAEMERISRFIGLAPDYSRISSKENARPPEQTISDDLRREVARHYASVFKFCAQRFPEVSELWPNAGLVE